MGLGAGSGGALVRPHFELLFRERGLPGAIRSDNGPPFASTALAGLSRLSVWWVRLGVPLERIDPGCPQQNGWHERMHLSLEQSGAQRPRADLGRQPRALEKFVQEYNYERPHEALGQRVPAELYAPSARRYEGRLPAARVYPEDWTTRAVRGGGPMKWGGRDVPGSDALAGERLGLEPRGDGLWAVWFEHPELGSFDERRGRIRGVRRLVAPRVEEPLP